MSTLYKIYGDFIHKERARISGAVGKRVIDQALYGDPKDGVTFKSQELFLRSKGGWSPTNTVVEAEQDIDPDMDESAIDTLMALLGKDNDPTETDNG